MIELRQSAAFAAWLRSLKDKPTRARIAARVQRLAFGHFGDVRPVGEGVSELRIHFGPGWRVYFVQRGPVLIVLLCGGDKGTQDRDIAQALRMARDIDQEDA
jgi:putative addiction module killer protein